MEKDDIRSIIDDFCTSPLSFLEIEDNGTHIKLKKPVEQPGGAKTTAPFPMMPPVGLMPQLMPQDGQAPFVPSASEQLSSAPAQSQVAQSQSVDEKLIDITAPLVGVFYAASSPDEPPYVEKGAHVEKGDMLCLIEAMKMMNEVRAPESGTVCKIAAADGEAVGFGDLIMQIEAD